MLRNRSLRSTSRSYARLAKLRMVPEAAAGTPGARGARVFSQGPGVDVRAREPQGHQRVSILCTDTTQLLRALWKEDDDRGSPDSDLTQEIRNRFAYNMKGIGW